MLLPQLETSNGRLFSNVSPVDSVLVHLTDDCEEGQAYDHGTWSFLAYLLSLYATLHWRVYDLNSDRHRFLFDGNIRCGGGFQDKG